MASRKAVLPPAAPVFTPASLKFLRSLARKNDRDWFNERRATYEAELKAPLLALIERVNILLDEIAPSHMRQPQKAMMRIFRDTRFSKNKLPLKTHVAAWWGLPGMERTTGPGFYLHVGAKEVVLAAGLYTPTPEALLAMRRWFADSHEDVRALIATACNGTSFSLEDAMPMTRVPRGFPTNSPAADLLRSRRLAISTELPPDTALAPDFTETVLHHFRKAAPLVLALDEVVTPKNPRRDLL